MRAHIFAAVCFLLMSGCDFGDGNCSVTSEEHKEENVEINPSSLPKSKTAKVNRSLCVYPAPVSQACLFRI